VSAQEKSADGYEVVWRDYGVKHKVVPADAIVIERPLPPVEVNPRYIAVTEQIGRWPTTAELAQLRRDNAALAKALGDVLDLADAADFSASMDYDQDCGLVHAHHLREDITAALSEVTP